MSAGEKHRWHFSDRRAAKKPRSAPKQSRLKRKSPLSHCWTHLSELWQTLTNGQTLNTPTCTLTCWPSVRPSSLGKASPPILIKVKETCQIKLMGPGVGPCFWLSRDVSTGPTRPGDSRFGVSVYPPPGQSVHTLTPACQRREQRDITRKRRTLLQSRSRRRVFSQFINKV